MAIDRRTAVGNSHDGVCVRNVFVCGGGKSGCSSVGVQADQRIPELDLAEVRGPMFRRIKQRCWEGEWM